MIDNDLELLDKLVAQADETLAAIVADVDQSMPGPDHPMWATASRRKRKPTQGQGNSILRAPGATQAPPAECQCQPNDLVPGLKQEPRIDLATGVVRCATCGNLIGKSCRTKRARQMRRIAELHHHHPLHVDVAGLRAAGWLL